MANQKQKLLNAQGEYQSLQSGQQAASGAGSAKVNDEHLDSKRHERGYDPLNDAERGRVSDKLNADSGRYRKGPGPL